MKRIKNISAFVFLVLLAIACIIDKDELYSFDYITAPAKVSAVFDITQDNTGLVSILPNAEGAQKFKINFGNGAPEAEIFAGAVATNNYAEGKFVLTITAVGITGLESKYSPEITVSYKAPENLQVKIEKNTVNPRIVSVSATADFATVFAVYFGDVENEVPVNVLPNEVASHTYVNAGDYVIRVVAKGAATVTSEYKETVIISEASDPVNLPINFESFVINYAFTDFGNVASLVLDNPDKSGINPSARVAQSVKNAGAETWAGTFLTLENPIDFSAYKTFKVKVWSPKSGAVVKLKVENLTDGDINLEVDGVTTVANQWEELTFDFSAIDMSKQYQKVVIFFDFGKAGDGSTYYFDDIKQTTVSSGDSGIAGTWKIAPEAGSIGVGPGRGNVSWWAIDEAGVATRACFYDDTYVFGADGSFKNVLGTDTWVEGWQGGTDACGTPVAPHDGSNTATYSYNATANTVTINGTGAFLGIPKAYNGGELTAPAGAPASITYEVSLSDDNTEMIVDINIGGDGWWRFKLVKVGTTVTTPLTGSWKIAPEAGSIGVGPGLGNTSWWAIDDAGVAGRACFFDDTYVFGADGSFKNVLGTETWVEGWQGGTDACGAPVAPHNGSNGATFTYNATASTVTLNGTGAFLGIPKAYNGGELTSPANAPASITYNLTLSENNTVMIADINIGGDGWWRFKLIKN
jgi:putative transposon-encoded protein